jgi:ParB family chromosome partitioning protein
MLTVVGNIIELEIDAIEINFSTRSNFNEESLKELPLSIKELEYTTYYC